MAPTSPLSSLFLLTLATASLAYQVPFYVRPTPVPADLPELQARQTPSPTTSSVDPDVDPAVESCSSAVRSFIAIAANVDEDLFSWMTENQSGSCGTIPATVTPPATFTSALSSLESHSSTLRCKEHSLIEAVWKTCAEMPQFSGILTAPAEECFTFGPCEDGWDDGGDEEEDDTEGDGGSGDQDDGDGDNDSAASRQLGLGAAAVAGSIVLAALQL